MMKSKWRKFKPGASVRTQLLIAALVWTATGAGLMARALAWLPGAERLAVIAFGVLAGTLKSRLILDRSIARNIQRILARGEGSCLGGIYSLKMWGVVALMIICGRLLRLFAPVAWAAVLYLAIGWGLLLSSRLLWRQWRSA